jgi:DNA-binding CsgD family transcriptional regulator
MEGIAWEKGRSLLRLINEAHELGISSHASRKHLLAGLCDVLDAPVSLFVVDPHFTDGGSGPVLEGAFHGSDGVPAFVQATLEHGRQINPVLARMLREFSAFAHGEVITMRSADVAHERAWRESGYVAEHMRPHGYGDFMASARAYGVPDHCTGFALARAHGERRFSAADRDLLHLFQLECGAFFVPRGLRQEHARLSPRMCQTLELLLTGASDKEVARALGISYHTERQYVKSVYRVFAVRSRAELLAVSRGALGR